MIYTCILLLSHSVIGKEVLFPFMEHYDDTLLTNDVKLETGTLPTEVTQDMEYGLRYDDYEMNQEKHINEEPKDFDDMLDSRIETTTESSSGILLANSNNLLGILFGGERIREQSSNCHHSSSGITFFVPNNTMNSHTFGSKKGIRASSSCDICPSGSQFSYHPSSVNFDAIHPDNSILNIPIGSFTCPQNVMCIEDTDGNLWSPTDSSRDITLLPVPRCYRGDCAVWMLFYTSAPSLFPHSLDLLSLSAEQGIKAEDIQTGYGFKKQELYDYKKIRGFSCSPCSQPIPYCF